jgi:hypothetical protein
MVVVKIVISGCKEIVRAGHLCNRESFDAAKMILPTRYDKHRS